MRKLRGGGKNKRLIDFLQSPNKKAFYGGGNQAHVCHDILMVMGMEEEFFIISDGNNKNLCAVLDEEKQLYWISEVPEEKKEYDILIAVNEKYNEEIIQKLTAMNFPNIYWSENWREANKLVRSVVLEEYLCSKIPGYSPDDDIIEYHNFRIKSCKGQSWEYCGMMGGEFHDLFAPSLFNDYSALTEGPYEWGEVNLQENDVVLDIGANIGMFTNVAASKAGRVYAFEPVPIALSFLQQNARLYDNIEICPYAVCDKNGTADFYTYLENEVSDIGVSSMSIRISGEGIKIIQVDTVTIDSFVKQRGLGRVDFIKADIEGAERDMLRGAQKTLAEFAPKLALCTYHLPDDKEVMERLILEANPDYVIEHKWNKLYAYVPQK